MLEPDVQSAPRLPAATATSGERSIPHLPSAATGWSSGQREGRSRHDSACELFIGQREKRVHVHRATRTAVDRAPGAQPPAAARPGPAEAEAGDGGRRVLVVEDNRDGLETLLALLDMLGYKVAGAADGGEALEQARRFRPHVVLLDLGLPVMDGLQVARTLRKDEAFADVYIAALTGWGAEGDRRRTAEAGFNAHLTKPVDLAALEDVLARATAREA